MLYQLRPGIQRYGAYVITDTSIALYFGHYRGDKTRMLSELENYSMKKDSHEIDHIETEETERKINSGV